MPLLTTDDLALAWQRDLTEQEQDAATLFIDLLVGELETYCNRPLLPRAIVGEQVTISTIGRVFPHHTPVVSIQQVRDATTLETLASTGYQLAGSYIQFVGWGGEYLLDYTAGLVSPQNKALKHIVLSRLTRVMAKIHDDALGVSTLTQEGYTAAYLEEGWTEQELKIADRRRRRVVRT